MPFFFSENEIESETFSNSEEQTEFVPDLNLGKDAFVEWNSEWWNNNNYETLCGNNFITLGDKPLKFCSWEERTHLY